jgi:hypothetical protein
MNTIPPPLTKSSAMQIVDELMRRIGSIERTFVRLLELQQGPRLNLMGAGTIAGSGTVGTSPATASSQVLGQPPGVIVAANPYRRGLSVQNRSSSGGPALTIGLGVTAPQAGSGIVIDPGGSWDGRVSGALWPGVVSVVASATGCAYSWLEAYGPAGPPPNRPA